MLRRHASRARLFLARALGRAWAYRPEHLAGAQTRAGAEATARRWLSDYGDAILRLAYSYLHNYADAEDVLQETLVRVLRAEPAFESASHERAYLLKTAANLSKNLLARAQAHPTEELDEAQLEDELDEGLEAEGRSDLSALWKAVRALPVAQRECIHLFYEEGYTTAQIARILGRKDSTVRSDLLRGRAALRKVLGEGGRLD